MLSPLIREKIIQTTALNSSSTQHRSLGGGSISEAYIFSDQHHSYFCKINSASLYPGLFDCEVKGLSKIASTQTLTVPDIVGHFEVEDKQVLILEMIESGERTTRFWQNFGTQLAALHQYTNANFGFDHSNYMGSIQQLNQPTASWTDFFASQRLSLYQACFNKNLLENKHVARFEKLIENLPEFFPHHEPPALVHGDLWSGNFLCNRHEMPVLIDPAVYYGHASADLAMTTLFGALPPVFYEAYQYHKPFDPGYKDQWDLCNLYPLLIHLLLFGKSYLPALEKILFRLS